MDLFAYILADLHQLVAVIDLLLVLRQIRYDIDPGNCIGNLPAAGLPSLVGGIPNLDGFHYRRFFRRGRQQFGFVEQLPLPDVLA